MFLRFWFSRIQEFAVSAGRVILGGFRFLDGGVKIRPFGFYTPQFSAK